MAAGFVGIWMSELAKLGEKVRPNRPPNHHHQKLLRSTHRSSSIEEEGEEVREEEEPSSSSSSVKFQLKSSSHQDVQVVKVQRQASSLSEEATICMLMDRFSPS